MKNLAVVAFGGNALLRGNEIGTVDQQEKNAYDTCKNLLGLIRQDYNLILSHGNGPQVGNALLRNEAGNNVYKLPKMPLDVCVADTQGSIGYMIERQMRNVLNENGIKRNVITVVTEVLVDIKDPAFENPTKPVGPYYIKEEADLLARSNDWIFREDAGKRGWRRVVASPIPLEIINSDLIKYLAEKGNIVIAVGGGGIPVYEHSNKHLEAIEAVVDKDLASAVLANRIGANAFYILTDVPKVFKNFHKPNQEPLDNLTVDEAKNLFNAGEFGAGSMGPKVMACVSYIEHGGKEAIITEASQMDLDDCGTRITR